MSDERKPYPGPPRLIENPPAGKFTLIKNEPLDKDAQVGYTTDVDRTEQETGDDRHEDTV